MTTSSTNSTSSFEAHSLYSAPYNLTKAVIQGTAQAAHSYIGPVVNLTGQVFDILFTGNDPQFATVLSTLGFAGLLYKGGEMALTPLTSKSKWIEVKPRFKSVLEAKADLVNVTKIQDKITHEAAQKETGQAKIRYDDLLKNETQQKTLSTDANNRVVSLATAAAQTLSQFNALQTIADQANTLSDQLTVQADQLEQRVAKTLQESTDFAVENQIARNAANSARQEADKAQLKANQAKAIADQAQIDLDEATEFADKLKTTVGDVKQQVMDAKKAWDKAIKSEDKAKKTLDAVPKDDKELPIGKYIPTFKVEKTKLNPNETHFKLPLSEQALVVKHKEMKDVFIRYAAGLPILSVGTLGMIDCINFADPKLKISESILGNGLSNVAWLIGSSVRYPLHLTGKVIGALAQINKVSYGVGNLAMAGGLGYGAYKLGMSTSFNWFDYKNMNAHTNVIAKDLLKVAGAIALASTAILQANEFLSGK